METQGTLKQMWDTRPPRIPEDQGGKAVVGGVCEGIGARYQLDPVFVRVLFAILSLVFGGGIFLYMLCWITMPRFGMTTSPWDAITAQKEKLSDIEKKERDTGWWLLVGLVVFFPSASVAGDVSLLLVTVAFFAFGWYLAHQRQPEPPAGLLAVKDEGDKETSISTSSPIDTSHLRTPEGYPHPGQTPPAWDPLGAAPDLWHLPEPVDPAADKQNGKGWIWASLAVLVPIAALGLIAASDGFGRVGQSSLTFYDAESIPDTKGFVGQIELDLSELEPLSEPKTVNVTNFIGGIDVKMPDNVPVDIRCIANIGETACPEGKVNADKEGEMLTLYVSQRLGSVNAYFEE